MKASQTSIKILRSVLCLLAKFCQFVNTSNPYSLIYSIDFSVHISELFAWIYFFADFCKKKCVWTHKVLTLRSYPLDFIYFNFTLLHIFNISSQSQIIPVRSLYYRHIHHPMVFFYLFFMNFLWRLYKSETWISAEYSSVKIKVGPN